MVRVELDDAGVAPIDHIRRLDGEDELLEEDFRGLVATVFGPRLAEALQFDLRGLATGEAEVLLDTPHLVDAEGKPHPLADRGEVLRRGVPKEDIMQGEGEGPLPEPLAQPLASMTTIVRPTLCLSPRGARRTFQVARIRHRALHGGVPRTASLLAGRPRGRPALPSREREVDRDLRAAGSRCRALVAAPRRRERARSAGREPRRAAVLPQSGSTRPHRETRRRSRSKDNRVPSRPA